MRTLKRGAGCTGARNDGPALVPERVYGCSAVSNVVIDMMIRGSRSHIAVYLGHWGRSRVAHVLGRRCRRCAGRRGLGCRLLRIALGRAGLFGPGPAASATAAPATPAVPTGGPAILVAAGPPARGVRGATIAMRLFRSGRARLSGAMALGAVLRWASSTARRPLVIAGLGAGLSPSLAGALLPIARSTRPAGAAGAAASLAAWWPAPVVPLTPLSGLPRRPGERPAAAFERQVAASGSIAAFAPSRAVPTARWPATRESARAAPAVVGPARPAAATFTFATIAPAAVTPAAIATPATILPARPARRGDPIDEIVELTRAHGPGGGLFPLVDAHQAYSVEVLATDRIERLHQAVEAVAADAHLLAHRPALGQTPLGSRSLLGSRTIRHRRVAG